MLKKLEYLKQFYLIITFCIVIPMFYSFSNAQSLEEKEAIQEGNNLFLNDEFDKARVSYEKALVLRPSSLKGNYNLGNTFYNLKEYDKAVVHYQKALISSNTREDKALTFHNLGNALMQQKKYKEAIEAFKNALRNNPSDNQTRYNFALAKKLLEDKEDKEDKPKLPKPSEFAKKMKTKSDKLAQRGLFSEAFKTMQNALQEDSTVIHYQDYIGKLNEVMILDTIQIR